MPKKPNADFNSFVQSRLKDLKTSFEQGEEVEGKVLSITKDFIFLDVSAKSEGILDRNEFEIDGELSIKEGDIIKAFFVRAEENGELIFTVNVKGKSVDDESIENAFNAQIPIEGRIDSERKGGYAVAFGNRMAFCPFSQVDLKSSPDKSLYIGKKFSFIISEYNASNFVVSRRKLLTQERETNLKTLKETLKEGDIANGTVARIMNFGVFVDMGGVDGLIPMRELAWDHVNNAEDIVQIGDKVRVKVLSLQWSDNRLTLSLKQAGENPWDKVKENYHPTQQYMGQVTKLTAFGAFVVLEPGVEGLIHISKLGDGKRLSHPSEVLKEGQDISVFIEAIDHESKRISLVLENPQEGREIDLEDRQIKIGEECQGRVEDVKPFGIFVKLTSGATGLLHVSEIPSVGQTSGVKSMFKRFPRGSKLQVIVKNIQGGKISLTLPSTHEDSQDEYHQFLANKQDDDGFGNLGSAFGDIKL